MAMMDWKFSAGDSMGNTRTAVPNHIVIEMIPIFLSNAAVSDTAV